ncbi:hypothetical protein [Timonella sp. A28]|uniref:hypothetical protein n=1 Tax=Timonella sp. A28 TaxID=3442640 RepID=UPI003EB888C1
MTRTHTRLRVLPAFLACAFLALAVLVLGQPLMHGQLTGASSSVTVSDSHVHSMVHGSETQSAETAQTAMPCTNCVGDHSLQAASCVLALMLTLLWFLLPPPVVNVMRVREWAWFNSAWAVLTYTPRVDRTALCVMRT